MSWPPIRPGWFFFGLALGLVTLGWLGRYVGRTDYHPGFVRFNQAISPEGNYFPTVDEMCAIARGCCRPDQVLVVVGGNSILYGVWQMQQEVWTGRLQELLGPRYCVVNFAFRGAVPTDCGAVVAEALRDEFPRQIYIANEAPLTGEDAFGSAPYRFVFWQAYFSGRTLPFAPRDRQVRRYLSDRAHWNEAFELIFKEETDRVLHDTDFWNWVGFRHFFTVESRYSLEPERRFLPRSEFPDDEVDGNDPKWDGVHYPPAADALETNLVFAGARLAYDPTPHGWRLKPAFHDDMLRTFGEAIPDRLKARTLILLGRNSPHYWNLGSPEDQDRGVAAIRDSVQLWRRAGYAAIEYGRGYSAEDYGDRAHLAPSGGRKLAAEVAPEVRAIAERLGYFK